MTITKTFVLTSVLLLSACATKPDARLYDNDVKSVHRNIVYMNLVTGEEVEKPKPEQEQEAK